jgi:5-methylcytosine-specific restriction protein A
VEDRQQQFPLNEVVEMRSVPEWIGKTDDERPPPRVRVRVFEKWNGMCHRSGRKIMAGESWALDHVVAIINGGANRESNLAPIALGEHRRKTREDLKEKSKVYRMKTKHLGIRKPSRLRSEKYKRKVSGETVLR